MLHTIRENLRRCGLAVVGPMVAGLAPFTAPEAVFSWLLYIATIYVATFVYLLMGRPREVWGLGLFYFASLLGFFPAIFSQDRLPLFVAYVGLAIICGRKFSQYRSTGTSNE